MRSAVIPCPFPPCQGMTVTLHKRSPGGIQDLAIIDRHSVRHSSGFWDRLCPASGQTLPLDQAGIDRLGLEVANFVRWRAQQAVAAHEASKVKPISGVGEHSLTPHPTETGQWFLTGPERKARSMPSAAEIKGGITVVNVLLAEAQQLAYAASGKYAEALTLTASLDADAGGHLAAQEVAHAIALCDDAAQVANGAIEKNQAYGAGL